MATRQQRLCAKWRKPYRCRVDYRRSDDLQPEIEQEALEGAVDNAIVIHAPKGDQRAEWFIARMNFLVHVERKYDLYHDGQADQAIWVQIGHGFPWHVENTYVTTQRADSPYGQSDTCVGA